MSALFPSWEEANGCKLKLRDEVHHKTANSMYSRIQYGHVGCVRYILLHYSMDISRDSSMAISKQDARQQHVSKNAEAAIWKSLMREVSW